MNPPPGVEIESLAFGHGSNPVLRGISFSVPSGRLLTLLGPSGCGKTTLLQLIGGYLEPAGGRISLKGRDVTRQPPESRNVGMIFQHYALFPHLTARQNVSFGLEARGLPRAERERRTEAMLDRVGLSAAERDRKPAALSGGQQQRVALARSLVIEPDVLLLDEPFANLDRHLRDHLRTELRNLQRDTGVTAIMATHDQDEALAISDLVGVMSGGRIMQMGTPVEVYARPRSPFVARFLGSANLLDGKLVGHAASRVMIRPEHCLWNGSEGIRWPGVVRAVSYLGADMLGEVSCDNGLALRIRVRAGLVPGLRGEVVLPVEHLWAMPENDEG
jgi:ABC-type Fe3+/spermidine/putrescine transport system ATPase subunit